MRVVITGSRSLNSTDLVRAAIAEVEKQYGKITELATGHESVIDDIAIEWAKENNIPIQEFKATHDNTEERTKRSIGMGKAVDLCIFIWDGSSYGTKTAIEQCQQENINYFIYKVEQKWNP